jgi:hypothetical protein
LRWHEAQLGQRRRSVRNAEELARRADQRALNETLVKLNERPNGPGIDL